MQATTTAPAPVTTATHAGGMRFTAEVRGHRIETDQPASGGGADGAAMPLELVGAALATCIALYVHQFLATRALAPEGLRVEVVAEMAYKPKRIGAFDVRLHLPEGFPEELRERVERVAESCPVHHTLMHPPEIRVALVDAAAAVA